MTTKQQASGDRPQPKSDLGRILREGYGPGAWHGPDLKAALADVSAATAYWRPGPGRHNIAEIAVHHAFCAHSAIGRLTGKEPGTFPLEGQDWFQVPDATTLAWSDVTGLVERQQSALAAALADIEAGRVTSALPQAERFDLVLGITCHAVYHAGQIQLVRALARAERFADQGGGIAAVYYVGSYDITDWERFKHYGPAVRALLPKYGGEVLASDTAAVAVEGEARSMHAIIRFPSKQAALGLYNDPVYQEAKRIRHESTSNCTMVLVEEFALR